MDKKIAIAIAVVAVVVVAGVVIALSLPKGGNNNDAVTGDIVVGSGSTISADAVNNVLTDDFTATVVTFGVNSDTSTAEVNISADTLQIIKDAKKGFAIATKDGTAKVLSRGYGDLITLGGDLTLRVTITKDSNEITSKLGSADYSEVRVYSQFDVYKGAVKQDAGSKSEVIFDVPYKLNDDYFEASENALQWDENLADSQAICSDKSATLVTTIGKPVYLAFMNKADVLYYPVTYKTQINGVDVDQTLNHKPVKVAAFWDNTVELALVFGLENKLAFAFTELDYECINPELQEVFDSDKVQSIIRYGPQSTISAYKEWFRTNRIDFILGWSSTFQDTDYGGLGNYQLLNSWGITGVVTNRPSNSVEDYYKVLDNVGLALNDKATADAVKAKFKAATDAFAEALEGMGITDETRRGAVLIEVSPRGIGTYGGNYIVGQMLNLAGGKNLFPNDSMGDTDAEGLVNTCLPGGVDKIQLIVIQGEQSDVDSFKADPKFATLVAAADQIVGMGFGKTYFGGVLSPTLLYEFYNLLYPENPIPVPVA